MKLGTSLLFWGALLALQAWVMRTLPVGGGSVPGDEPARLLLQVQPQDFWIHALLLFSLLVLMPLGRGLQPGTRGEASASPKTPQPASRPCHC